MTKLDSELVNWYASVSEATRRYFLYAELYKRNPTPENFNELCFWYEVALWGRNNY